MDVSKIKKFKKGIARPFVLFLAIFFLSALGQITIVCSASSQKYLSKTPFDFDGDGKTDIAVYYPEQGGWNYKKSTTGEPWEKNLGWFEARPVPGDYDGDGKTDLAVHYPESGDWHIRYSSNGTIQFLNWVVPGGLPVPEDYDGDGKTDLAVFKPRTGNWYILYSSGGTVIRNWGWSEARPVPGDYDGDGKTDLAVYNSMTGNWYILYSSGGSVIQNWGWFEARPVPGDYDGDGKTDLAVYHHKTGSWYVLYSSGGSKIYEWGSYSQAGAIPLYGPGSTEGLRILAFGDSITYGISGKLNGPESGYPILLERKLSPAFGGHFIVYNQGVPGEVTYDGLARFNQVLTTYNPDLILLMEGTNDHYFQYPFATIESNIRSMVGLAQSKGKKVIIATIPPVISNQYEDRNDQQSRIQAFNPTIYTIASDYNIPVAQVYEAITSVSGWETLLMDQISANHPNDAGYHVVRDAFFKAVSEGMLTGLFY